MPLSVRWMAICSIILLFLSTPVVAFHEQGVRACEDGEIGYIAMLMTNEGGYTFLSSEDPPRAETVICQIAPKQLIQVKAASAGL